MLIEKVYFAATDDIQLFGLLHKSEKENKEKKVILSVHGMTSNCTKKREEIFAEEFTNNGIDYFSFNNRGSDIITYFEKVKNGKLITRIESGSANEVFENCYCDIKGAILMLLEKGYKNIYLQGHSYGSAKIVYTYNRLKANMELDILSSIKNIILLSIVDVPRMTKGMLGEKFNNVLSEIKQMVNENRGEELIKREYFLHPITANNFLFLCKSGGTIDVAPFGDENADYIALNNIEIPLLMMWGKERDLIMQKPEELERIIKKNVKNEKLLVKFIDGTGHNYRYKEKETAEEILKFLKGKGKGTELN